MACRLYNSPKGFPRTAAGTQTLRVKLASTSARCVFDGLKPGTYAIVVHHDENDNKKFDTNALGVPLEGYGVSNNRTYAVRAPRWEESRVKVEPGKDLEPAISIRY